MYEYDIPVCGRVPLPEAKTAPPILFFRPWRNQTHTHTLFSPTCGGLDKACAAGKAACDRFYYSAGALSGTLTRKVRQRNAQPPNSSSITPRSSTHACKYCLLFMRMGIFTGVINTKYCCTTPLYQTQDSTTTLSLRAYVRIRAHSFQHACVNGHCCVHDIRSLDDVVCIVCILCTRYYGAICMYVGIGIPVLYWYTAVLLYLACCRAFGRSITSVRHRLCLVYCCSVSMYCCICIRPALDTCFQVPGMRWQVCVEITATEL